MTILKQDLTARDIMTPEPMCVEPSTTIRQLAMILEQNEISGAPVVDQQGRLIGIVSKSDLIRSCSEGTVDIPPAYLFEVLYEQGEEDDNSEIIPEPLVCVQDFMTESPVTVSPKTPAAEIAKVMCERHIHRVIVVDYEKYPVGMITTLDLLRHFAG